MVNYRWNVGFVLRGVWLERPVQIGTANLQPAPPGDNGTPQSTGFLLLEVEQCLAEPEANARAMQDIELVTISATAILGSVLAPRITPTRLENRQELEALGIPTPSPRATLLFDWDVIAPLIDENKFAKGYLAAAHLPPDERQPLHLVARWLWKANSEHDPYDQMLALWISCNVLYGPFTAATNSERKAIECYAAQRILRPDAARLLGAVGMDASLDRLKDSRLLLKAKNKPPLRIGDQLRNALAQGLGTTDPVALMTLVLLSVYAVRCGVVHEGRVVPSTDEEVTLLWASRDVLKAVIMHALQTRLGLA